MLWPAYLAESGVELRIHAAGSGRALQMLAEGLVDLVISHAPGAEASALARHPEWARRDLAHNRFIVVGPRRDPADVRGAPDAADAFRRIARSASPFVSRGDLSGTHERENVLWDAAGARPSGERLIVSGRGMSLALRHADEVNGYTLSDEATFEQLRGEVDLDEMFAGDPALVNPYSVIYPRGDARAAQFADWLLQGEGRRLIGEFRVGSKAVFQLPPEP